MQKGTIGVTTDNIFPIIKKFLYSDHEIFLRELVSNAVDATQKLKSTGGSTYIDAWLKDYANEASVKVFHNPSDSQILKWLKDGCALVIHVPVYSGNGHYMAVLDVNQNDEIYISNPDSFGIERME